MLKVLKNLHGLKQRRNDFHEKLKAELISEKRNFVHSDADPCAFCEETIITLCCVDDFLMFTQDDHKIDEIFKSSSEDFLCTDKGEADGCLEVEIR